jgi:hypothetical protein
MSARLMTGVGVKERTPAAIAEVSLTRQRAFTLLVRVYDHMRRGVSYLRWDEGDVDTIAPSLYAGRNTARRRSGTDIPTTPETPVPPVGTTPSTPTAPIPPVPIGHQGGSPLMS